MAGIDFIHQNGIDYEIVPEIAPLFKTTVAYHTGDHVIYDAKWYTFKADKAAGAWDATKVNGPFEVADQLTSLKEDLKATQSIEFVESSIKPLNLIKRVYLIPNQYINTDGTVKNSTAFYRTDYIEIEAGEKYRCSANTVGLSAFYDEDYEFISSVQTFNSAVTAPLNAKYLRCSIPVAYINNCFLFKGSTWLGVTDDGFVSIDTFINPIKKDIKLLQGYDWKAGYISNQGTIITPENTIYRYSDYVYCPANTKVTYIAQNAHPNVNGITFYDVNHKLLVGYANNGTLGEAVTVVSPANTQFCRLSTQLSILDATYVSFGENTVQYLAREVNELDNLLAGSEAVTGTRIVIDVSDAGIVNNFNPVPTKLVVNGINQWDEQWELGNYGTTTGNPNLNDVNIRSKNTSPIPVLPSTEYYWKFPLNINSALLFYKEDGTYTGTYQIVTGSGTFTTPNDAHYMKFYLVAEYGTTYNNDIQIAFNDDSSKLIYHAYEGAIYTSPSSVKLTTGRKYIFAESGESLSAVLVTPKNLNHKEGYESGYIHFTVPVNQHIVDESVTTDVEKDNENTIVDVDCILSLPTSYTPTGKPTKLIMMCHGAGRGVYGASTAFDEQGDWRQIAGYNRLVSAFLNNGYAVFDCNGYSNTNLGCSFWGAQRGVEAWRKAYDYVVKNYNVEENISVYGFSMGGCTALNLAFQAFPNIKCIAIGSPVTNLDETTYEHAGSTAFNAAWGITDYDADALLGNNPMANVIAINNIDYCFKTIAPLKVWFGGTETWPAPSDAQKLVTAIKNAGGKADFRSVDGRGHGISYGEDTVVVNEIVMYFNRYNN